jgi:alanine-glyoxylate transaminase/serine-glyoxylate transaminase/serine-pyruvate transaminase
MEVYDACVEGLKRVLKTRQHLFMYTGSGHAAWEASLVNLFSPGDAVLILETGHFSDPGPAWRATWGWRCGRCPADWRQGVDMAACARRSPPTRTARSRASAPSTTRPPPA